MSEGENSPGVRKSGSQADELKAERPKPKARKKSEAESPKSESQNNENETHSTPDSHLDGIKPSERRSPLEHLEKTINSEKSKIKTMEVHHHPDLHHEKKPWKEYVLEGLMIFLAVTMGFFAESLREHINEQSRAKEYAVTLYSDLKSDAADLKEYVAYFKFATANTDTLMQMLSTADPKQITAGKLYYFGLFGGAYHIFTPHDATLLEMKNSGSLRFFGDKVINRKLALYDQLCQSMKLSDEKENGIYVETRKARAKIFEFKYNEVANDIYHGMNNTDPYSLHIASRWAKVDSFKKTNPPLLSYDKTLFNEYVEMVRSRFLGSKVAAADTLLNHSTELIGLLKKKYDLEKE